MTTPENIFKEMTMDTPLQKAAGTTPHQMSGS